jgi:carbon-monoxide dehydrogenase medium subunit
LSIEFLEPASLEEAVTLLGSRAADAKIIAGGTSVVLMLQQRLIAPGVLVSLGGVPGLDYIRLEPDGLHIGGLASLRELERSQIVKEFCPALAHACRVVANVRVRNQATLGGNMSAADYAADPPAMLSALDARLKLLNPRGERELPLSEFFLGFYTTALEPDEILTEVFIPTLPALGRASYQKYTSISAEGRPCVAAGALVELDPDGRCKELRVAVGAAVETPQRLQAAEGMAAGHELHDELIAAIADEYARGLEPLSDVRGSAWYRTEMIRVFVKRALQEARDGGR